MLKKTRLEDDSSLRKSSDGQSTELLQLLRLLLTRLERVSVDSYWAHRASGIRGSLLRSLEKLELDQAVDAADLSRVMDRGFRILERAAKQKAR